MRERETDGGRERRGQQLQIPVWGCLLGHGGEQTEVYDTVLECPLECLSVSEMRTVKR